MNQAGNRLGNTAFNHPAAQDTEPCSATSELERLEKRLCANMAQIHSLTARATSLANRLLGAVPEETGNGGALNANPISQIDSLSRVAGYIDASLEELTTQLARLERL